MPEFLTGRDPGDERDETPEVAGGEREARYAELLDVLHEVATDEVDASYGCDLLELHALLSARPAPERHDVPGYYYFADSPGVAIPWQKVAMMLREAGHDVMVQPGFRRARPEPVSEPEREDEAYAAGASHGRYDWDAKLVEAAAEMRAKGYDAATLRALTDHILGGEDIAAPGAEPVAWLGLFRDRESGGEWERDGIYDTRPEIEAARSACVADHGYAYAMVPLYASPPSERAGERELLREAAGAIHGLLETHTLEAHGKMKPVMRDGWLDARARAVKARDSLRALADSPAPSGGETR